MEEQQEKKYVRLTIPQRIFVLKHLWKLDVASKVQEAFKSEYPDVRPPNRKVIYALKRRFEKTGSVADLPKTGCPRTATHGVNMLRIAEMYGKCPDISNKLASEELNISINSVARMKAALNLPAYRPPKRATNDGNFQRVAEVFKENPGITNKALSEELNISTASVSRMKAKLNLPSYKPRSKKPITQNVNEDETLFDETDTPLTSTSLHKENNELVPKDEGVGDVKDVKDIKLECDISEENFVFVECQ